MLNRMKFLNRGKLTSSYTSTVNSHNHWFWTLYKDTRDTMMKHDLCIEIK